MIFQNEKTYFQAIKTRSSKSGKIDIFPKGLTHGFVKKLVILRTFFQAISARKMCFMIFQNEKTLFQEIKTTSFKSRKIEIFPNGLTDNFAQKWVVFFNFFFKAILTRKMFFMIFSKDKRHFQAKKATSSKSGRIDIFAKGLTHGFSQKFVIFPTFFFQAILARKMCFMIFQNGKTHFQAIKTRISKSRKIDIFAKGLTHGFAAKLAVFPFLFLDNIGQKNVFCDFLERKTHFQAIKTRSSKSQKLTFLQRG